MRRPAALAPSGYQMQERLYHEVEHAEDDLAEQRRRAWRAGQTEAVLREEVARLRVNVRDLEEVAGRIAEEAAAARRAAADLHRRQGASAATLRRQAVAVRRTGEIAHAAARGTASVQHDMERLEATNRALELDSERRRSAWEAAVRAANLAAQEVSRLNAERSELLGAEEASAAAAKAAGATGVGATPLGLCTAALDAEFEEKHLLNERAEIMRELHRVEEAAELIGMLEEQRRLHGDRLAGGRGLLDEISELRRQADDVEEASQNAVEALQIALEEGAAKETELRRAHRLAEQWRHAMLAEAWQQKREHLRLQQCAREEDLWLAHLQTKADGLVEELLVLEERLGGEIRGPRAVAFLP